MKKLLIIIGIVLITISIYGQLKVTVSNVNLRTTPEIKENIICVISKGTAVTVVKENIIEGDWVKVNYKYNVGYIRKDLLKNITNNSSNNSLSESSSINLSSGTKSSQKSNSTHSGATAICNDGTYSYSAHRRGTCSHHGGVREWL